ncbi:Zinc finger CCCH domain-containing protein 45 [Apostasia shenzhenica]|uniref:Zinc finger CCCH domain-containing protein 45 n=1 Tax=Apostasia shenzhenica TaxID=1088818 RepID=A0A2I0B300_9ASPA|nr:Zinc finger CCCH domain-containing protein 45 [Apostasia shenzhenica]
MEDPEGSLSFDFEGGLEAVAPTGAAAGSASLMPSDPTAVSSAGITTAAGNVGAVSSELPAGGGNLGGRRSFRQTVCRHWLRSLCMKGDACGFLHQYDKARMPVCRFFRLYGECREQDCVYKHTNEDIKECNMYKFGFCPNGPDCRYRHAKLPGPPPPAEEVFQKIQQLSSFSYGPSNRFFQHRNAGYNQQTEKPQISQGSALPNQPSAPKASGVLEPLTSQQQSQVQQTQQHEQQQSQQQQPQSQQQQSCENQVQNASNGLPNQAIRTASLLPPGQSRYFIVKSCNRENLEISVQQGVWATQRSNEAKLNEAFESTENVILIFSINRTRHFQGCAKMTSKIGGYIGGGNWKYAHGTAHYGRNFSVKWLKLCELSFNKTHHLRNPYNDNLPVKISRDCQELEPFIGEQLASLLYLEPDSELMQMLIAAELKREEEKAKGASNTDEAAENPDIVLFDDNEEEEEEESEEEEEAAISAQGRGRGRGMFWPPPMPLGRGGRPVLGMRGFPPVMMGVDGFGYGAVGPDGFTGPDFFSVPPRVFPPYGAPRFSGDFSGAGPMSGLVFPGRAPQPGIFPMGGLGMMMASGRGFMGGMSMGGVSRPNRPMGIPPFIHPPAPPLPNNRAPKRDQRRTSERYEPGFDQGSRGQEMAGRNEETGYQQGSRPPNQDRYVAGNRYRNDDSESDDEAAPRRSRHGDSKKRRVSEGEGVAEHWETPLSEVSNH